MVTVLKRPRLSIGKFKDVYQIDLPADRSISPDRVIQFYQARGVRDSRAHSDEVCFSRGKAWRGILNFSDLSLRQEIRVKLQAGEFGPRLICEYLCFCVPLGTIRFPPWDLEEEVEQLEAHLTGQPSDGRHPDRVQSGKAGTGAQRKTSSKFRVGSNMTPVLRILYVGYRLYSGARYRAVRRFTRLGLMLLGALAIAALLGLDLDKTIAYQAFAVLVALMTISVCLGVRFRGRFSVERFLPRFGTVGTPIQYAVSVRNLASRPQVDLTLLENLVDVRPAYPEWRAVVRQEAKLSNSFRFKRTQQRDRFKWARVKEAVIPTLVPGGQADAQVQLTPLRRGVLRFSGVTIARTDPFGVVRSFAKVGAAQTTLILPRRYPLPAVALPGAMKYQEGGVALASNVGRSEEFVSLRDYRRGDPLRKIHWRSWAKTGKPIVKECEDEFFVRHALVLDTFSGQPHSEVFEEAISVAASFACTVLTQESLLDLLFVGTEAYCFTAGRGLAHADQMLEILASVQTCEEKPFRELETAVLNHVSVVSGCICVLLTWDEERRELVRRLRMLEVPVLVLVIQPRDSRDELDPGPMRDAPDQFHVLEAGRIEEGLAKLP